LSQKKIPIKEKTLLRSLKSIQRIWDLFTKNMKGPKNEVLTKNQREKLTTHRLNHAGTRKWKFNYDHGHDYPDRFVLKFGTRFLLLIYLLDIRIFSLLSFYLYLTL
jgi:hypothetical protein